MNVIETLMAIGGVVGIASVGLFVSGRMNRWWTSILYTLITISLGLLAVVGFYSISRSHDPVAVLWYTRIAAATVIIALTSMYFLFQELRASSEKHAVLAWVDRCVVVLGAFVTALAFTPVLFAQAFTQGDKTFITTSWGALAFVIFMLSIFSLVAFQLLGYARHAYKKRYGAFDLRFVVVRTISYFLTIVATVIVYGAVVFGLSRFFIDATMLTHEVLFNPVVVVAALIAALAFQPIRRLFNALVDAIFYKENYSIADFTVAMSQTLNSTNDLRTLLERVSELTAKTVRTSQAFFFVELLEGHYVTAGTERHSKVTAKDFVDLKALKHDTVKVLTPLQFEKSHPIRRMMVSHRIGLIVQIVKGGLVVGYLCLGHSRRAGYTVRDVHALQEVSDELAVAIQNAISVDEVKKLNQTLEQRVIKATQELRASNAQLQRLDEAKDEFISMASHQLRTPLTSIKGYISMLIDGDLGEVTKEQKHFLSEAFVSSERMVRLIGDFLNVSRLQTGRFVIEKRTVDLALLVQHEIDGLERNAAARGITFKYKRPKSIPTLELDENKIQQVIMNFSDNAIYYSKEKSKIVVDLHATNDYVEFTVTDTGIGIPEAEQEQLFNKFFRATNARRARPDGTGVGLFLAKKVIDDHGGEILFKSTEGKGSTFGFRIPLDTVSTTES